MAKNKFNAKKTTIGDLVFDSTIEAEVYLRLRDICQTKGLILELQPEFELIPTQRQEHGRTLSKHTYTADFQISGADIPIVIDVKSEATEKEQDFTINEKLLLFTKGILLTRIHTVQEAEELADLLLYS